MRSWVLLRLFRWQFVDENRFRRRSAILRHAQRPSRRTNTPNAAMPRATSATKRKLEEGPGPGQGQGEREEGRMIGRAERTGRTSLLCAQIACLNRQPCAIL
jgi:hypothetical protein